VAEALPSAGDRRVFLVAGRAKVCLMTGHWIGAMIGTKNQEERTSVERVIPPPEADALSSEPVQSRLGRSLDTTTVICSVYSLTTQMQGGMPCPARRKPPNIPWIEDKHQFDSLSSSRLGDTPLQQFSQALAKFQLLFSIPRCFEGRAMFLRTRMLDA